jgi:hypothetical protein
MAGRATQGVLDLAVLLERDFAGPAILRQPPAIGAGAQHLAVPLARQHRPAGQQNGRFVGRRRPHQLRGNVLVAARQQHHAVQRLGADHLLGIHRHQVAIKHRRRRNVELAQGNGGKLQRPTAGLPDAALDRLGQFAEMNVAVVQLAPGLGDADDRFAQVDVAEARRLEPGATRQAPLAGVERTTGGACEGVGHGRAVYHPACSFDRGFPSVTMVADGMPAEHAIWNRTKGGSSGTFPFLKRASP